MMKAVDVLVVTAPGCHFCEDATRLLDNLAELTPPLNVTTVPLASDEGRYLVVKHRVPFPPIVLIDGDYFGYGRISERKLKAHLMKFSDTGRKV